MEGSNIRVENNGEKLNRLLLSVLLLLLLSLSSSSSSSNKDEMGVAQIMSVVSQIYV